MMAKDAIKEPFCVINCDDFYNRDAFMVIGKFLSELPEGSKNDYAMVGFRVGNTLSENGTVARGICSKDDKENLTTVVERTEVMRVNGPVSYKDEDGKWVAVEDNTPVSMNMWGFTLIISNIAKLILKNSCLIRLICQISKPNSLYR